MRTPAGPTYRYAAQRTHLEADESRRELLNWRVQAYYKAYGYMQARVERGKSAGRKSKRAPSNDDAIAAGHAPARVNWNEGARGRVGGHGSSQTAAKGSRQHMPPFHHLAEPEGDLGELLAGDLALAVDVEVAHCRFNSLPFAGRGSTCSRRLIMRGHVGR